jgi:choline-sulfatase
MSEQPNFLMIMSDQHGPDWIGGMGCPAIQTPALDGLMKQGVSFRQAYCAYPMCTPSRASYMTGRLATGHGVWELGDPLNSALPTWAHVLRHAGYVTSISGRMHFVGADQRHGFERRAHPEYSDPIPGAYGNWDRPPNNARVMLEALRKAGAAEEPTAQERYDEAVTRSALGELDYLVGQQKRPWALQVGYLQPHFPYRVSRAWYERYEGVDFPMPRPAPGGGTYEQFIPRQYMGGRHWLGLTTDGATPRQVRAARQAYFAMISCLDHQIGQLLDKLKALGVAQNTWVIYASDHGDNLGEHGMWSKMNFFEESVRVPLIVAPPECGRAGAVCEVPVSLIDWMATALEMTGQADGFEPLAGRSLLPLLADPGPRGADRAVIADYACEGTRVPMRMVRQGRWKASFAAGFEPVLYDLEADPHEWHDLGGDPGSREVLEALYAVARSDGWNPETLREAILGHKRRLDYLGAAERQGA